MANLTNKKESFKINITPYGGYIERIIMPCADSHKELLNRIARAEGHLKKVRTMIKDKVYCIDIITQSLAVQSALRSIDELIMKNHLQTCVRDAIEVNKDVPQKIDEVIKTMQFMRK